MVIYLARNTINGKVYIGQTIRTFEERKSDHLRQAIKQSRRSHFHAAIRKYGFSAFEWEILEHVTIREKLDDAEILWIKKYKSADPRFGYNNTHGGGNYETTPQARLNMSIAFTGRKMPPHAIEAMRVRNTGDGNPFFGKRHSEEAKAKNRAAHVGRKLQPEHIAKCIHWGESNPRASLTTEKVIMIKKLLKAGVRNCEIQRIVGVSKSALQGVKSGKSWGYINV